MHAFATRSVASSGGVHLSAARLFEGHVNAFQLLWIFGTEAQRESLCAYVADGGLLGVWNAPSPHGPLTLTSVGDGRYRLHGYKAYASGAGFVRRPLVTATHAQLGHRMIWPDVSYSTGSQADWQMQGMRSSVTRSVHFEAEIGEESLFGTDDDYHRQPYFSGGSWRFLAAQLGAGEALVELMRGQLNKAGRHTDIYQQARMSECVTALETARKWVRDAASLASGSGSPVEYVVQHANEARVVVERALLDTLEYVHRGLGLQSFSRSSPVERRARDLATYLRQPAPDALLTSIGEKAFVTPLSGLLSAMYDNE